MKAKTGQTIIETILSLDADNNPVTATTFNTIAIQNGAEYPGITINMNLIDGSLGLFKASWSADTIGDIQIYIQNTVTNVVFISDIVSILPDSALDQTIYIGL